MAKYWIKLNVDDAVTESHISDDAAALSSPWQEITEADYDAYELAGGLMSIRNAAEDYDPPVVERARFVTPLVYQALFLEAEITAIAGAVATDDTVRAAQAYTVAMIQTAPHVVDRDDTQLVTYLDYLETETLIGVGRADIIRGL